MFSRTIAESFEMGNLPVGGLILLAFLGLPLVYFIFSFISVMIITLFLNLFLKIVKGLNIYIREEDSKFSLPISTKKGIDENQSSNNFVDNSSLSV